MEQPGKEAVRYALRTVLAWRLLPHDLTPGSLGLHRHDRPHAAPVDGFVAFRDSEIALPVCGAAR